MSSPPAPFRSLSLVTAAEDRKDESGSSSSSASSAFSLSSLSSAPPNYRTISTQPSPTHNQTAAFSAQPELYRGTQVLSADDDDEPAASAVCGHQAWGSGDSAQRAHAGFGTKELTLRHFEQPAEPQHLKELPEVRVVASSSPSVSALPLPAAFDLTYSFTSSSPTAQLLQSAGSAFASFGCGCSTSRHDSKPRISGVFYDSDAPVKFSLTVFTMGEAAAESGHKVVELLRRRGDLVAFQRLYLHLLQQLVQAGHVQPEVMAGYHPLRALSPPPFDMDEAELDASVQELWMLKASSSRRSDAQEGLRGLRAASAPIDSSTLPLVQQAICRQHDAEQQRLGLGLLERGLSSPSAPSASAMLPLLPSLFSCMGALPASFESMSSAASLLRVCDELKKQSELSPLVLEQADLIAQVQQTVEDGQVDSRA